MLPLNNASEVSSLKSRTRAFSSIELTLLRAKAETPDESHLQEFHYLTIGLDVGLIGDQTIDNDTRVRTTACNQHGARLEAQQECGDDGIRSHDLCRNERLGLRHSQ